MHTRTVDQVRSWDSRPFNGGLDALSALSDENHTGAVVADDTWLFMLNGRVIGLFEGAMDDFESTGTVFKTPYDSLPLLFSMQEREGRTRAKYFTEETPLAEADATLADANFTGYIELSENVLSGDYYLVYYGGERRSAAFIGQSERVETGKEAFEKASEEVGLYEVKVVSMNITEIPAPVAESGAEADTPETVGATGGERSVPSASQASEGTETAEGERETEGTQEPSSPSESVESEPESASAHIDTAGEATRPGSTEQTADASDATQKADEATGEPSAESAGKPSETSKAEESSEAVERSDEPRDMPSEPSESEPAKEERTADTEPAEQRSPSGPSVTDRRSGTTSATEAPSGGSSDRPTDETTDSGRSAGSSDTHPSGSPAEPTEDSDTELERMFRAEAEWRQTRAIPALDPDDTEPAEGEAPSGTKTTSPATTATPSGRSSSQADQTEQSETETTPSNGSSGSIVRADEVGEERSERDSARASVKGGSAKAREKIEAAINERDERIEDLESRLAEVDDQRSELEGQLETEREQRAKLERELEELREERDRLADRIEELKVAEAAGSDTEETSEMQSAAALSGTNLFVRYGSKSEPTLEALGDDADQAAINANLTLEHHTQFDVDSVTVDGKPFREFLESTGSFRFVDWVLRELPYELQQTGNRQALGDLFEAIPDVDRIEFDGSITVDAESGTDSRFALVMRDRMGNPLIVGEYTDRRNPVQGSELQALLDGARDVAETTDTLAGAFYVTASFFEPPALETAENAASTGGLFSRQEKASYVTPDSGSGFHLGLVEDRSQSFHVTVPKL